MMIVSWLKNLHIPGKPDEWEVKELLKSRGIRVPDGFILEPDQKADFERINFPVAVKVCDSEILHKTDVGGVSLNINDNALIDTILEMRKKFPGKRLLVEKMSSFSGLEFIIGGLVDPTFGPAVMVGAGGILTELYRDVTFRLVPLDKNEAVRMLRELTVSAVLEGYRGSMMDIKEFADIIVSIGDLIVEIGDSFSQLDINPFVFTDEGWMALDGMLVLNK